jgi:hypothetical protein
MNGGRRASGDAHESTDTPPFSRWLADLEARHLANLRVSQVSRALRALSSGYVERRTRAVGGGRQLDGAGKRAAFALYYAPLHYLLVQHVAQALPAALRHAGPIVDLGCGTGAASAALLSPPHEGTLQPLAPPTHPIHPTHPAPLAPWHLGLAPRVLGIDAHPWAVDEARHTFRVFDIDGTAVRGDAVRARWPHRPSLIVAAFFINETQEVDRASLKRRLLAQADAGTRVLIVEPLARGIAPWWDQWAREVIARGGRADDWKLPIDSPPVVARLGRAAGLSIGAVSGRSLWV